MHWSAYLAYRQIPTMLADATVIGDVQCITCGYNLRGLRAVASCPECGQRVADSLFVLAKPAVVAAGLRGFANSYRTFLIFPLGCVNLFSGWPLTVTALVIGAGAIYRAWNAGELRSRARLGNSSVLQSRARWLFVASVIEAAAALIWAVTAYFSLGQAGFAWLSAAFLNAAFAGWFGLTLASMLGYGWMVIEFRVQLIAVAVCVLLSPALLRAGSSSINAYVIYAIAAVLAAAYIVTLCFTWLVLHHAGNAAEQEYGSLHDVLANEQVGAPSGIEPEKT